MTKYTLWFTVGFQMKQARETKSEKEEKEKNIAQQKIWRPRIETSAVK